MTDDLLMFVGTYTRPVPETDNKSEGIYAYRLDLTTGALAQVGTTGGIEHPAYLAIDPQQRYLYAVSEVDAQGAVCAFALDRASGGLEFLNYQPSQGMGPCHVWVDGTGRWVFVANYRSGTAAVYPVLEDGRLGEAADIVQHLGSSVNAARQEGPHAHCIMTDPASEFVLLADLGIDKLMVYQFDQAAGKLTLSSWAQAAPGAGPRHIEFHPSGRYCFLINELDSTLTAYAYADGVLREVQTVPTLPADFDGQNTTAAVHVSPDGRFVYGSNRGHDTIAIFAFDADGGTLTPAGHVSSQGKNPRDFIIDPTGKFLIAANQDSHTIYTYAIDPATGGLTPTGHSASVPMPVCLKVLPANP